MATKRLENKEEREVGAGKKREDLNAAKETALPGVRFAGQQPGEDWIEKDRKSEDGRDDEKEEDRKPKQKPSTEGKFSA